MRKFLAKHAGTITGTLSCFDRLLFKGHLALGYDKAMEDFLTKRGILFKDLKAFVLEQADRIKAHAHAVADEAGRPCLRSARRKCLFLFFFASSTPRSGSSTSGCRPGSRSRSTSI